jgi:hypothetical protein
MCIYIYVCVRVNYVHSCSNIFVYEYMAMVHVYIT